jgi:hypothetical protein
MNSKFNAKHLIFIVVMSICFVVYYHYSIKKTEMIWEELKKEYPALSYESELDGVITRIVQPDPKVFRNVPNRMLVMINDSLKIRLRAGKELKNKTFVLNDGTVRPMQLGEALSEGDKVVKEAKISILSIHKIQNGDTVFYDFELTDDLGYPLTKIGRNKTND